MKKYFVGLLSIVLFLSGCSNDAKTDSGVLSNATPTLVTPTGLEISPTLTPTPTPTPLPLAEGEIPLFPDEAFRVLLSALIDTDKNGILTLEERKQLTELRNTCYDMENSETDEYYEVHTPRNEEERTMYFWLNRVVSLEGIEYFPKLRLLVVDETSERDWYYDTAGFALAFKYWSFGQYLATYDNSLTLIGYANSWSKYNRSAKAMLFSGAVYDGNKGLRFQASGDDNLDFRGIRNGFVVQNVREIELFIAEDGMVEVSDTFLSEGIKNNLD